jgi:DNA-binding NarL/FixJ family response regulator
MISVVVVADVRLYREGIVSLLRQDRAVRVEGGATDAVEAAALLSSGTIDVAVVDLATSRGIASVQALLDRPNPPRIVVVATDDRDEGILAGAERGVAGYVTRDSSRRDLSDTIQAVARGETRCSDHVASVLLQRVAALAGGAGRTPGADGPDLTTREREIAALVGEGLSNKEIATALSIEVATVKNHVHRVIEKLDVRRRGQVAEALRRRESALAASRLNLSV